jgi:hypothetical protein
MFEEKYFQIHRQEEPIAETFYDKFGTVRGTYRAYHTTVLQYVIVSIIEHHSGHHDEDLSRVCLCHQSAKLDLVSMAGRLPTAHLPNP